MLIQPSCNAYRRPPIYALALGVGAFVVQPLVLPLLNLCPVEYAAAALAACRPVSEEAHATERHPGQEAFRISQNSASTMASSTRVAQL